MAGSQYLANATSLPSTKMEMLYCLPASVSRPLSLINGHGYAAVWLPIKITRNEEVDKSGNVRTLPKPHIEVKELMHILVDDGVLFGPAAEHSIDDLGYLITIPPDKPSQAVLSPKGVKGYLDGNYPDPSAVFLRIQEIINQFIDFRHSLESQQVMCEFIACYILSTWMLDAFNVASYLWLTGEKGSGKTNLLILISKLAFLGQFLSESGSFASLRDLADCGATLCFDDAEKLANPAKVDPDKSALFLAGNRRGLTIPIKELGPDKKWHIRQVNAYCPRVFSATQSPDSILASRAIIVPLVRTPESTRGNCDPFDDSIWIHDHRQLIDDLWCLALKNLHSLTNYDSWVGSNAQLIGRNLQPWRSILSIAKWLEDSNSPGLYTRMHTLALLYQQARSEVEVVDVTRVLIQVLTNIAQSVIKANPNSISMDLTVSEIVNAIKNLVILDELDIDINKIDNRRIGRILGKLRFSKTSRPNGIGSRVWHIKFGDLSALARSYSIDFIFTQE